MMRSSDYVLARQPQALEKDSAIDIFLLLPILAASVDLLTPLLIWKGIIPASLRWISHAMILMMILICFTRVLAFNYLPRSIWFIAAVSVVWTFVAVIQGQGILTTIWGLWLLFQFPFAAVFAYLQPGWPARFAQKFRNLALACLALEVAVQYGQYILGESPGDNLAGTFGVHGTGNLIFFILFVDCLFLGQWITTKRWMALAAAIVLSVISSVLGEMKLFFIGIIPIGGLALLLYTMKHRTIWRSALYTILIASALYAFNNGYNRFVPGANQVPLEAYLNNPKLLGDYLNLEDKYYVNGNYYTNLGRNAALTVGWESLQGDPVTLLFGWGIGTRSESVTLGTAGLGIQQGDLGLTSGTGVLVILQEMGVLGLIALGGFFLWVVFRLSLDIRRNPSSETAGIRYALALFTCFWPLWLWYNNAWILRVPMLLYWGTLGYVLSEAAHFPLGRKLLQKSMNKRG